MLDTHPPHEAIHTWKSFFIHIATIVIGLLIAVGLEQTIEHVHHQHQLRQAREELSAELHDNRIVLEKNVLAVHKLQAKLDTNMAQLRAVQASHAASAPKLDYTWFGTFYWPADGAWQTLKQSGGLSLMAHSEVRRYAYVYDGVHAMMDEESALASQMDAAGAITHRSADGSLLPVDIQELITATSMCQGKVETLTKLLRLEAMGLDAALPPAGK